MFGALAKAMGRIFFEIRPFLRVVARVEINVIHPRWKVRQA
jgi:hypothetical protein